jgi:EAL and modified HD-GYP domain-containing signal transduction protein
MLNLAESSEGGDLQQLTRALATLPGISPKALNRAQTQALIWANSINQEKTD